MPVYSEFSEWARASNTNRVYAVTLSPVLRRNASLSWDIYLCTEPMLGHGNTVFDGMHEYVPCVTGIPDIHHSAQVLFSGSNLVSFGAIKITMNPEVAIDPATEWDAWDDGVSYGLSDIVRPNSWPGPNGYHYECIAPGVSGDTEPNWPIQVGDTVSDGTCTWQCKKLTWDILLDEWVFAGHKVVVRLGGPELAWVDWATVLTGYMGEPTYTDTECTIPIFSPAAKALQAEMPLRTYDPDQWPDRWEAEAYHDRGDIIAATSAGFEKISVDPAEVIASSYSCQNTGWEKWRPENAFDGDTTIYQVAHGDAESQWNRWVSMNRAGGPSGVDYIGIKKAAAVQVDRVRIFQMAECWMPSVLLQCRDSSAESWTTLCEMTFTVAGNAWEVANLPEGVTSAEHKQWRLLANADGSGSHWSTRTWRQWGLYELEFLTAGETKGYLYICTDAQNDQCSGVEPPATWPITPGEIVYEAHGGYTTLTWRCLKLPTDGESKPVPLCYGQVKNLTPVMLDSDSGGQTDTGLIFQFHDSKYGAAHSVDMVYLNGVEQTEGTHYDIYAGKGIIHFKDGVDLNGPVTMDVQGAELAGTYSELPGDIIRQWLSDFSDIAEAEAVASYTQYKTGDVVYGVIDSSPFDPIVLTTNYFRVLNSGETNNIALKNWQVEAGASVVCGEVTFVCHRRMGGVDLEALEALNQDLPFPVGIYISQRMTVKRALDDLLAGLMAWWGITREGDFTAARFKAPDASSALIPWLPFSLYRKGQFIRPRLSAFHYECLEGGLSGHREPSWPEVDEAEISDGTADQVIWQAHAIEGEEKQVFSDADILAFQVAPEERLVNKCTVYGDRNWTPGQSMADDALSMDRQQWLRQQWRERIAEANPDLIRTYPLAATMSHQTFLVNLEDCASLAQGYIQLFGVKREKVRITLPAHGLLVSIGDQVLVMWNRYGYADGLFARVVAIRETHGPKPQVVLEAWR